MRRTVYSEQVNEIISAPPKRILRWGTSIIVGVFALMLLLAWLIRYPDIIPAPVEITTMNPPVTLTAKKTGRINILYVKEGQNVSTGSLLAVMETAASISEFHELRALTDTVKAPERLSPEGFPPFAGLGELQPLYAAFLKALTEFDTYVKNDLYGARIRSITREIEALTEYAARLKGKERLLAENMSLERKQFERDSGLYASKILSESDFEKSRQLFNARRLALQEVRLEQSAKSLELAEKNQVLQDYRLMREQERMKLGSALREAWQNLRAEMRIWEINYLLVSPVDGTVTFTKYWSENQSVTADEPVLTVIPSDAGEYIGRINLSMQRSGKVKAGSAASIKLSGYPYMEYGMVRGVVRSKSLVATGDYYTIELELPDGLTTLYGEKLEFTQKMQGTAEIMTDRMRLLQKMINPFRHIITRNRNISLPSS
ncbi:MAG: HlyD family secretion protein [Bacteroidales bacterium]|jgi:HlyD family secretion protein|nr:HlyD family secretion protein [Bacteroidales bacterium]